MVRPDTRHSEDNVNRQAHPRGLLKPVHLIYISNARLPTERAHGYQIMKMCEAFGRCGATVDLLYARRRQSPDLRGVDPFAHYGIPPAFGLHELRSVDPLRITGRLPKRLHTLPFRLQNAHHTLAVIAHTRDMWRDPSAVFYGRDLFTLLVLCRMRGRIRGKLVYEAHTLPRGRFQGRVIRSMRPFDGLVTVTEELRERFAGLGFPREKVLVAPDAVDLESFDLDTDKVTARERVGVPSGRRIASFVGRYHTNGKEKGIPDILRAATDLVGEFPDLDFYFIGGPLDWVPRYEGILVAEGLPRDRFCFRERRPIGEVPYYLKASDVLLMPHPWSEFYAYEVSPLKMFEYMSAKRPIVASRLPAIMEVLRHGENALLGEPGDPKSIAENIRLALKDRDLSARVARQAYADVQEHTWMKRAARILGFVAGWDVLEGYVHHLD